MRVSNTFELLKSCVLDPVVNIDGKPGINRVCHNNNGVNVAALALAARLARASMNETRRAIKDALTSRGSAADQAQEHR